jgi:hypothetical protein
MGNIHRLLLLSPVANFSGATETATERANAPAFLAEHFTVLGVTFQRWMPIIVGAVAIYVAWLWCTGRLSEASRCERARPPRSAHNPSDQIPEDISHAFGEALILLIQWRGGADEPAVMLDGEAVPIGFVFDLVIGRKYSGQMPRSMSELLQTYARREPGHRIQADALRILPTYEVGARCLLKWVGDKKSKAR